MASRTLQWLFPLFVLWLLHLLTVHSLAFSRNNWRCTSAFQRPQRTASFSRGRKFWMAESSSSRAIDASGWPDRFPAKKHCSKCGLCETSLVSHVTEACAFLNEGMARMDQMEVSVHGRGRNVDSIVWSNENNNNNKDNKNRGNNSDKDKTRIINRSEADEARFGVMYQPMKLARGKGVPNAQWTGCVTGIALSMLEAGKVDAVVCIGAETNNDDAHKSSWSTPEPILAKTVEDVLRGRGVKPALAPSLRVLDAIRQDPSIRKLLFCGVGCAVQAFRAVQHELDLDEMYVLGTNCADNSPTYEAAQNFIRNGVQVSDDGIRGYEFMQDFRVHVKTKDGYIKKPYFTLPGSIAEASIAPSCLACFDYTNGLADVVVGYMGAPLDRDGRMETSFQTLTVRNERGAHMVQTAIASSRLEIHETARGTGSHEQLAAATVAADSIVIAMVGGEVKQEGMPRWMGEIMATIMTSIGPKGVNFARYSIDYHILRNYLHVLDEWGEDRANHALPRYARDIVEKYLESDKSLQDLRRKIMSKK